MCTASSAAPIVAPTMTTTPQQGSAVQLRQALRDLNAQRLSIEEEISMLSERLNAPGQPGIKGSLLDKQGFPRADINVHQVRRDRHRLICLTNDQKALTDKLAVLLAELHAAMRAEAVSSHGQAGLANSGTVTSMPAATHAATSAAIINPISAGGPSNPSGETAPMDVDGGAPGRGVDGAGCAALVPFALVDEVTAGSPAAAAGLQVGDLLCAFGDISAAPGPASVNGNGSGGGALLGDVAAVLRASEGRPVATRVLRQGAPLELSLTPQRWAGRGLLGCHLRPL